MRGFKLAFGVVAVAITVLLIGCSKRPEMVPGPGVRQMREKMEKKAKQAATKDQKSDSQEQK